MCFRFPQICTFRRHRKRWSNSEGLGVSLAIARRLSNGSRRVGCFILLRCINQVQRTHTRAYAVDILPTLSALYWSLLDSDILGANSEDDGTFLSNSTCTQEMIVVFLLPDYDRPFQLCVSVVFVDIMTSWYYTVSHGHRLIRTHCSCLLCPVIIAAHRTRCYLFVNILLFIPMTSTCFSVQCLHANSVGV